MGKDTNIEWCDHSFNPWWGCTKVSDGCKNCYAETWANQIGHDGLWGEDKPRRFLSDEYWKQPLIWNRHAENAGERYKVFCGSMCDVFEDREDLVELRRKLFSLIKATPHLDWLLLTKRPENFYPLVPLSGDDGLYNSDFTKDFPNVWIGVTVENQEMADKRIPELLKIPAKVRFLSCEPLLDWLDISPWTMEVAGPEWAGENPSPGIDWVICGGESGDNKRQMELDWARELRDQCKNGLIPFFMKQIDKVQPIPEDLLIQEFPNV